jgi:hypothetical protein
MRGQITIKVMAPTRHDISEVIAALKKVYTIERESRILGNYEERGFHCFVDLRKR